MAAVAQPRLSPAATEAALAALKQLLGDRFTTASAVREQHGRDESWAVPSPPDAVVFPRSTEEVVEIVKICAAHGLPIVPYGAGTSLEGHVTALQGGVSVDLMQMNQILKVNAEDLDVVVQPGVRRKQLNEYLRDTGLFFPIDPGADASIGGMVATRASGTNAVRYGTMRENVLALTVVMADGRMIRTSKRAKKSAAGYDLTRLFVGSEGTLGVITEITLALRPTPEESLTLVAVFPTTTAAGDAVARIAADGASPSLLELLDRTHLAAIEAYRPMGLRTDAAALLLAAADTGPRAAADLANIERMCLAAGATEVYTASDATEAEALLAARRLAYHSMEHLAATTFPTGNGVVIVDDIAVPRTALAETLDGVARIAAAHGVMVGMVAHAGDGNLHPNIIVDQADPASVAAGQAVFDEIMELALSLGGTSTGEHGVGLLKRDWLAREVGPVGVRVHRAIKQALDPANLLNPGKVL